MLATNSNVLKKKTEQSSTCAKENQSVGHIQLMGHQSVTCVLKADGPAVRFDCGYWLWANYLT